MSIHARVKLEGAWRDAWKALGELPSDIRKAMLQEQRNVGRRLQRKVIGHLLKQDLNWAKARSPERSGDPRLLIDTEAYIDSITTWQENLVGFVGVKKGTKNAKGQEISFYAYLHEFGYKDVPARPLWGPSIEEMGGAQGIRDAIAKAVFNKITKLRSKGFTVQ